VINYVRSENFLEISIVDTSPIVWNKFVVWFALSRPHPIDISTRLSLFQPILHILYLKIGDHVVSTFWLYLGKPYSIRNLQPRIFREYGSYINACIFKILLCARARAIGGCNTFPRFGKKPFHKGSRVFVSERHWI